MKLKLPQLTILKIFLSFKILMSLVIIIIIIALGYLGWFLYNNLYKTITQTEQIIILRAEVSPFTVNLNKFNTILETLEKKTTTTDKINWQEIKNPFAFIPASKPVTPRID